jgi:cytochrome bd-type quinol oxidase subunit 2
VRGLTGHLDPVLAPVTLLAAALLAPFVVGEVELQNTSGDEHAHMAHYFDMAWLSVALVLVGVLATVLPSARRRALWTTGGLVAVGAARTAFTPDVTWSLLAVALGLAGTAAVLADRRRR